MAVFQIDALNWKIEIPVRRGVLKNLKISAPACTVRQS